ncbi:hypothetical protein L486_07905 [Kwoniella mangroviensis CBS 10435]|uniref:Uncharacterized protein n=1 Tax=Kwoniella mangroviensis CBS 10435 TaxID=1331196 RepID=A0A1B9IGG5_9TREE|nr:uncharacterized protein I203_06827 [Kwoniella mangroviensis CBS 8507]OCF54769.1 hypothetical protein L486_07905 [Kwoniella mangroviensis CBS 10435]OCF64243.1 hypothetical protein I203_06827 [Kwoniella mangroviensis CBS 8507]OCF78598.1 hypothetical protein I204_00538 [Kwoniella mangroviensis CBS 8886]
MSSERTPLLSNQHATAQAGPSRAPSKASSQITLNTQANQLISHLKSPSAIAYSPLNTEIDLAVHLYALHLLDPKRYMNHASIRARIADSELGRKLRDAINDRIEDLLDRHCNMIENENEHDDDDDEDLQVVFWKRWKMRDESHQWINAIDLMLPPFTTHPSPLLSHPLVRHTLDLAWTKGIVQLGGQGHTKFSRIMTKVVEIVTPSRLHFLHLASFLVLYGLTLSIALSPANRISPYEPSSPNPSLFGKELWWALWTASDLVHSSQYRTTLLRRILLLPLHLSLIFALFPSYSQISYTLLLFSIPTTTFSLVFPIKPSLPLLFPSLLPLSILLKRIIYRSFKTAGLLMPLVLGLFVIFSWSMNGDIFRGFYQAVQSSIYIIETMTKPIPIEARISIAEPVEDGISPFSARLTIFVTLSLLFICSLLLTASRAIMVPKERWDGEDKRRWRGAIKEGDNWEKEYRVQVAREARECFCEGVRGYMWQGNTLHELRARYGTADGAEEDGAAIESGRTIKRFSSRFQDLYPGAISPVLPPPLSLVTLPLDILRLVPLGELSDKVDQARYTIGLVAAGLFCLPSYLCSSVLGGT